MSGILNNWYKLGDAFSGRRLEQLMTGVWNSCYRGIMGYGTPFQGGHLDD